MRRVTLETELLDRSGERVKHQGRDQNTGSERKFFSLKSVLPPVTSDSAPGQGPITPPPTPSLETKV